MTSEFQPRSTLSGEMAPGYAEFDNDVWDWKVQDVDYLINLLLHRTGERMSLIAVQLNRTGEMPPDELQWLTLVTSERAAMEQISNFRLRPSKKITLARVQSRVKEIRMEAIKRVVGIQKAVEDYIIDGVVPHRYEFAFAVYSAKFEPRRPKTGLIS
jgi:hypothetical protein